MMTLLQLSLPTDSLLVARSANDLSIGQMITEGKFDHMLDNLLEKGIDFVVNLLIAVVLFLVGRFLIIKINNLVTKIMRKSSLDNTLKGFINSALQTFLYIVLFMIIINSVGVKTVSIAAIIGTMGLAIGLAMKDNLANFAGGVMLLFNKPFKAGDYIEAQDVAGTVRTVGILYTSLTTFDNKTVHIPNGPLSTGNIINYSTQATRRIDLTVSVEYGSNVEQVKQVLLDIAEKHPNVLKDPAPFSRMTKMNHSSIDFVLRIWATSDNYWPVTFDLNEQVYDALNKNGLIIPFQQMTIHLAKDDDDQKKEVI